MPVGSFFAQRKAPKSKKERSKPKPPRRANPQQEKKAPVNAPEEELVYQALHSDSSKLHILLWGRNLGALQEFLCAASENMSQALQPDGLTFFTTEHTAISDIVDRKKRLERFFWEFSTEPWVSPESSESGKVYTFSISPAGNQDKTVELVFHCCPYGTAPSVSAAQADALWYLVDGPVLDEQVGYDPLREFIRDALGSGGAGDKPQCLLLSQIEKYGHFGGIGGQSILERKVSRWLTQRCRELFAGNGAQAALIPVQIYGGLEYTGTDENCCPILRLSQSGYYQSYIPENCQVPGLYTIRQILYARGAEHFAEASCGGMTKVIHRHFLQKKGVAEWKPDMLKEAGQE